ncbi:MAG: hypothetical protein OEN01_12100 [Candidatus Krumholzibacteria bacterium]|nr:hypothetical protein [Candidatus Krumholzibacteria bacterium]
MRRNGFYNVALICFALVVGALVSEVRASVRDHSGGFFLRLSAGFGGARTELTEPSLGAEISGATVDFNLAIGGVVVPNLALHGTLFGWVASDPDLETNLGSGQLRGDVDLSGVGAGVTYYFMPVNIYVSGSIGGATLSVDTPSGAGETDIGPVLELTVGKEWWVADRWGLGAAAAFGYHSVPEKGIDDNWSGTHFAIRFTATLN